MKENYWTIDACPEAGGFDTLAEAKRRCDNYTEAERRALVGTVIYHTVGDDVVSCCEVKAAGFGRVKAAGRNQ